MQLPSATQVQGASTHGLGHIGAFGLKPMLDGNKRNYWRDLDTALFILKHLYQDIPDRPEIPDELLDNEINQATDDFHGWYNNEEAAEDDLPLTFSNSKFVKKFSRRAKSFIGHG
ncbi:hypothetical protein L6452_21708 [Arctium lappa]|uniref:Uncharacterized protein n=1 Tax=Arctium lappa TaxID=4217 RepID=A0ACB9AWX1_ARCLA|nr:hypothetical protein L6452_21708 [Arctium lappa]